MESPIRILMVEDTPSDAQLVAWTLTRAGLKHEITRVDTETAFIEALDSFSPDVILSDFSMPQFSGTLAFELAKERAPDIPFIYVSGTIGEEIAIESIKKGATDYVLKGNLARLPPAIERALQEAEQRLAMRKVEAELNQTRERFELFMRYLSGLAFIKDARGRYQFVNPAWEEFTGKSCEEVLGRTDAELWPEWDKEVISTDRRVLEQDGSIQLIETLRRGDEEHSFLVNKFRIPDANGASWLIGGVATDFTERLRAEAKVRRLSRIYALMSDMNSTIVRVRVKDELLREACRIAVETGGFRLAWIGMREVDRVKPCVWVGKAGEFLSEARYPVNGAAGFAAVAARCISSRSAVLVDDIERELPGSEGASLIERGFNSLICLPLLVQDEVIGVGTFYSAESGVFDAEEEKLLCELAGDISFALEYFSKQDELNYVAYYDPLTGLANRTLFCDRVRQAIRSSLEHEERVAVAVINLERFSAVNESLGRQAGDYLLKAIAGRLLDGLGPESAISRLGGDTFAFSLTDIKDDADAARLLEECVLQRLGQPFQIEGDELRFSFKCGIAFSPGDATDAESLVKSAEAALKRAKSSNDKYMFYAPEISARIAKVLKLESQMRNAITEQQFVLHYQPKYRLDQRRLVGMEALLRWNCPERGMVSPAEFIPVLEDTGLILDVGPWVLREALRQQRAWREMGFEVPRIAVNISSLQLCHPGFISQLTSIFDSAEAGSAIDLEITESVIMQDIEQYIDMLQRIRALGIGIEVDDFGTGYSSLSYIAKLPATALKIDRSFIQTMSADNAAIVSTIISLAHSLDLKVVAEGVETEEQFRLLKALQCDVGQGYLLGRPAPANAVERLLAPAPADKPLPRARAN